MTLDSVEIRIRDRAYQIWEKAGRPDGMHFEHFEKAREEIESEAEKKLFANRIEHRSEG
jgi:hypothetical protein